MDEVGVAPQSEFNAQVSQVVLTRDRVGSRAYVHEHVDVRRICVGVGQRRTCGAQREITVVQAALRPGALAVSVEIEVEATFDDTDVSLDPLWLEQPSIGTRDANTIENLSVRHPILGHERSRPRQRDGDIGPQRCDH